MKETLKSTCRFMVGVVLAAGFLGCSGQHLSSPREKAKLPEALTNLGGQYVWDDQKKRYHYSDKLRLDTIVTSENRQQVLPVLVACIDDKSLTKTQLNGKFVMLGILCYQALTQIVYYEHASDRSGDIATNWPGHITPVATLDQLRSAKKAWQQVLDNNTFIFL